VVRGAEPYPCNGTAKIAKLREDMSGTDQGKRYPPNGGVPIHRPGFPTTTDLRDTSRASRHLTASLWLSALVLVVGAQAGEASRPSDGSVFEELIQPIFQVRCGECHGERRQKGKLALHTAEAIARGGETGPLYVAGRPEESLVLEMMRLPLDEEDHMPPSDKRQPSAAEVALLARWIETGASLTAPRAELGLSADLAEAVSKLPALLAAVPAGESDLPEEIDPVVVLAERAPLADVVAKLQRRFPGALTYESRQSAELHFTAMGLGREFGDAELALLGPLGDRLERLDVSGTSLTDGAAATLARFSKLKVLRAGYTGLGDAAVAALAGLTALESCSLHHTAVTDASVAVLGGLPALRSLHLAGTAVSAEAMREGKLPVVESRGPEPEAAK